MAANLLDNEQRSVKDRITAYALYTDPPLGRAGMTEVEVRKTGKPALIATLAMEDVSRAFERGETNGFMKVLVDRDSEQILVPPSWVSPVTKSFTASSMLCMPRRPTP